jgi:lipoyl(octanoyl) transferase
MVRLASALTKISVMSTGRVLHWSFLGRVRYEEGLRLQLEVREALRRGTGPERLLLLEHPPVYTLGRNASRADLLWSEKFLAEIGIEVFETDRGGKITYHGPGQLVGYPIVDLNPDRRDVRRYIRDLGAALIDLLAGFGVKASWREGDALGVWVGSRKIASLGVHLSRWRTTHGFALNLNLDLSPFRGIVPCGLSGVEMTSLARELGNNREPPPLPDVAASLAPLVASHLGREAVADPLWPPLASAAMHQDKR